MWRVISDISMQLAEWLIVVIMVDDIYGFKEIQRAVRKYGKMRVRRFHRQFLKTSKKYFKKRETPTDARSNEDGHEKLEEQP